MADINFACLALNKGESSLDGITRDTNFGCPDIGCTSWNDTDNAVLTFGVHYSIDYLIDCAIATIGDDEIVAVFSSFGSQFHCLAAIFFEVDVCLPARGCQNG